MPIDDMGPMEVGHPEPGGGFICMCCDNGLSDCNCVVPEDPPDVVSPPECLRILEGKKVDLDNGPDGESCSHWVSRPPEPLPWKKLSLKERRPCEWGGLLGLTFDIAKTFANKLARGINPFGGSKKCDEMAEWFIDRPCSCGRTRIVLHYCDRHKKEFEGGGPC